MQLTLDGIVYNISEFLYTNQSGVRVPLSLGTTMPAPILNKSGQSSINVHIGGSSTRSPGYTLRGGIRQLYFTPLMNTATYSCLASCNNQIYTDGRTPQITTSYNPVSRTLSFNGASSPSVYTNFLQSLVYADNGYLTPQETGSTRVIILQATGTAMVTITGLSNQFPPVLDANGNLVDGIDFNTALTEGSNPNAPIYDPRVFIYDQDINPYIAWVNVTIINPLQPESQEYLTLTQNPPSMLTATGNVTQTLILTSIGQSATNADFITALLSVVYVVPGEAVGGVRTIQSTIYDGKYVNQPPAYTYIMVVAIDEPPVLTFPTGLIDYVECSPSVYIASDIIVQDPDNTTLVSARIQLGQVFDVGYEYLSVNLSATPGVVCSPTPCSGPALTIMGSTTVEAYNQLLRTLQYVNLMSSLANLRNRNVTVTLSDGVLRGEPLLSYAFCHSSQHTVLQLDAPNQNYSTNFTLDQTNPIPVVGTIRVVDPTVTTLQSVVVSIRSPVPDETLTLSSFLDVPVAVEVNNALKSITFSAVANLLTSVPTFATSSQLLTSVPTFATSSQLLTSVSTFATFIQLLTSVSHFRHLIPAIDFCTHFRHLIPAIDFSIDFCIHFRHLIPAIDFCTHFLHLIPAIDFCSHFCHLIPAIDFCTHFRHLIPAIDFCTHFCHLIPAIDFCTHFCHLIPAIDFCSHFRHLIPAIDFCSTFSTSSQLLTSGVTPATSSQLLSSVPNFAISSSELLSPLSMNTGRLEINTGGNDTYEMITHPGTTMLPCEAYGGLI
eukprot:Em0007g222a